MTYQEALETLLANLSLPKTQGWVTIDQLYDAAEKLDDDSQRFDD